jgi:TonB family protein
MTFLRTLARLGVCIATLLVGMPHPLLAQPANSGQSPSSPQPSNITITPQPPPAPPPRVQIAPPPLPAPKPPPPPSASAETAPVLQTPECLRIPYPEQDERDGNEGVVRIRMMVSETGQPDDIEVLKSSGHYRLDQAAIDALKFCEYRPARVAGRAISRSLQMDLAFALKKTTPPNSACPLNSPRFVAQSGGVLDRSTGLTWSRCNLPRNYNAATGQCDGSAFVTDQFSVAERAFPELGREQGGPWRMPTIEELNAAFGGSCTRADLARSPFSGLATVPLWSGTVQVGKVWQFDIEQSTWAARVVPLTGQPAIFIGVRSTAAPAATRTMPRIQGLPIALGDTHEQVQNALGSSAPLEPFLSTTARGREDLGQKQLRYPNLGIAVLFDREGRALVIRLENPFTGRVAGVALGDLGSQVLGPLGSPLSQTVPPTLTEGERRAQEAAIRNRPQYSIDDAYRVTYQLDAQGRVQAMFLGRLAAGIGGVNAPTTGSDAPVGGDQAATLAKAREAMGRADWRVAQALLEPLLEASTKQFGERHRNTLISMNHLAQTYGALGRTAEAFALNERVLRLNTEDLGERHRDTLTSMNNLAHTYGALGRTTEALTLNEKVLRLRTEILSERHPDTLTSMNNLANTYAALGRTAEQLALAEKVLRLSTEIKGERHPDTVTSMNNLAAAYGDLGRPAEQLALAEKVLRLRTEILGERHADTLTSMNNLAVTYGALGRTAEQLALAEKVLRLSTEIKGERHPDTMISMNNLAATYGALGRTTKQLTLNEKVLRLRTEIQGERHPDTMLSMSNLAATYSAQGRAAEALALNEKVLRLRTDIQGERHPDTLTSMNNLAVTYGALGRTAEQLTLSEKVLRLRTEIQGERHPDTLASMSNLAGAYTSAKRFPDASALSTRYVAGAEAQRSQPGLSAENRQSVFQVYATGYRFFSIVHGLTGQTPEALRLSELSKARTLLETMAAQRAGRAGALPAAEQDQLDSLNRQTGALDQQIAQARSPEARQNLEATRNDVVRQFQALQTRLRAQYPKYAQLSDVKLVGAVDLPGLVPADAVAVSYLVSGTDVSAFVVDTAGQPRYVSLAALPNLADAVEILRRAQSDDSSLKAILAEQSQKAWRLPDGSYRLQAATLPAPKDATELTDAREVAQYLSAKLLQPLAKELQSKPRWIISPDGPLAQLTFESLPFVGADGKTEPAIAAAEIHYTQSLSVYALSRNLQKQYETLKDRQALFAMGNPDYTQGPLNAVNPRDRRGLKRSTPVRVAQQLRDLDSAWVNLPGTETEVKAVAKLFPGSASTYLGAQATEQQLQALNDKGQLKNYRYLLMSAHGYLSAEQPALSSIVLGLKNRTPDADGYVTASEWPGYDLRSDLTVLSACDSGVGKVLSGEGVMGLPFALFVAGNVNTILSLWPVDDEATAEFVTSLFAKIRAGQSAAQALAQTKREFAKHRKFSHPTYWAPFILVGAG